MIELYHDWDSLMSFKVRACLAEKNLDYVSRLVELTRFEHLSERYLALNPNGVVPTLVHDGDVIIESSIINEYLDETFPRTRLVPDAPFARARMRAWVKFGDDILHHGIRPATFELMIKPRLQRYEKSELEALIARHPQPARAEAFRRAASESIDFERVGETVRIAMQAFDRMESVLGDAPWLVSRDFTLADVMAMSFIDRIDHLGLSFLYRNRPVVADWVERLVSRPSFSASAPPEATRLPAPDPDTIKQLRELF